MREIISFNENWSFSRDGRNWEPVTLPHTWNAVDGMDGSGEYYRGVCRYQKDFPTPILRDGTRVFLEVLACSLSGIVLLNGEELACHEGGYSSFTVDITDALRPAREVNTLTILADNSPKSHIYPQLADFTFYGGLYRGVNLLLLPETHFDVSFHGGPGLAVTPEITDNGAILHLNSWVVKPSPDYTVRYTITDAEGKDIAESWRPAEHPKIDIFLAAPHLWQGVYDPYLYCCTATLVYRNETPDQISTSFGIRSFFVDPEKGFFLNGIPMMLRGVARHQDRLWQGNALTREQHYEDAALIAELGANTIRLAHYQHGRDFYDACDKYGFIVWAEIPYISCQSDDPDAHENCRMQLKELIYQNYNHPSICFWGISNEITIGGIQPGLAENHRNLHMLVKELDPGRLTAMAHVSMLPPDSELHGITDVEGYNHYFGWYGGSFEKNETWLDEFHENHPEICLGFSEYGTEGIITRQTDHPMCRDYSERYQAEYHEHMARILSERPFLWCAYVWNMFDFGSAARNEGGIAGRNNKGLITIDREVKKEAFYLYKAYWSREPFVYLCGRRYAQRAADSITVKVYSNCSSVTLYVNGRAFDTLYGDKIFLFENVPLGEGFTFLTASAPAANIGVSACSTDSGARLYAFPPQTVSDSMTLEQVTEQPEIYAMPRDNEETPAEDDTINWFDTVETVASDAPMEFSEEYFSVYDKINTICSSEEAFSILSGALYAMTGIKIKKSTLSMLGEKTLLELADMAKDLGGSFAIDESRGTRKIPENALQIINAELRKVKKPGT
ncbi:MAG: glycoside hydrolase family 2 protein [Acetatifactor sp.]|nr:glycoside hydrolase family 2 protein [Acetatifactor sp.]